ncbi:MAG: rhodanese-like domain-containing protein [Granulosicoccaceae bacterium]
MADNSDTIIPLTPAEAFKLMQDNPSAMLVDVRSDMEFLMIGHPTGAVHVPWIDEPDWIINPDFCKEVRRLLLGRTGGKHSSDAPIMLICRSGNRSDDAANALQAEGLKNLYVINSGFEGPLDENHRRSTVSGWRYDGLPWEQT